MMMSHAVEYTMAGKLLGRRPLPPGKQGRKLKRRRQKKRKQGWCVAI